MNETIKIGKLADALRTRFPNLGEDDVAAITERLLSQISDYIDRGYSVAVVKRNEDATIDLIMFDIEKVDSEARDKERVLE